VTNVGIIDYALHPPLGLLTSHLDTNGPYIAGTHQLTSFSGTQPVGNTFGVLVRPQLVNAAAGFHDGFVATDGLTDGFIFYDQAIQLATQHQLASGLWVTTQLNNLDNWYTPVLWDVASPGRLQVWVAPKWSFDLYYLLVL
jgi:hypothetical protein